MLCVYVAFHTCLCNRKPLTVAHHNSLPPAFVLISRLSLCIQLEQDMAPNEKVCINTTGFFVHKHGVLLH